MGRNGVIGDLDNRRYWADESAYRNPVSGAAQGKISSISTYVCCSCGRSRHTSRSEAYCVSCESDTTIIVSLASLDTPTGVPLLGGTGSRVVGMGRPVGVVRDNVLACPGINGAGCKLFHGDAVLHWADIDAEITRHAFLINHLELPVRLHHDGLV